MVCTCIHPSSALACGRPAARSNAALIPQVPVARPLARRAARPTQVRLALKSSSQNTSCTQLTPQQPASLQQESACCAAAVRTQLARIFTTAPRQAEEHLLPLWVEDFQRQVPTLPQGLPTLTHLLLLVNALLERADACACSRRQTRVLQAYLQLALVDVVGHAWRQRMRQIITRLHGRVAKGSKRAFALDRLLQQARSALAGCRYLRLHAAAALASAAHTALDNQGYNPSLDLAAVPGRSAIGLCFAQLLQEQLAISLDGNQIGNAPPAAATHAAAAAAAAAALPKRQLDWGEYLQCATDPALIGSFEFDFWTGRATFHPAPFPKGFSTRQLQGLLSPTLVLGSLTEGSWGSALLAAARQAGLGQVADQISRRPAAAAAAASASAARAHAAAAATDSAHSGAMSAALAAAVKRVAAVGAAEKRQVVLAGCV